jgi:hypothetical protein
MLAIRYHERSNIGLLDVVSTVGIQIPVGRKLIVSLRVDFVRPLNSSAPSNDGSPGVVRVTVSMNTYGDKKSGIEAINSVALVSELRARQTDQDPVFLSLWNSPSRRA